MHNLEKIAEVLSFAVWAVIFFALIVQFFRAIRLVPTQQAYIVERLGRYQATLRAGFHPLLPFVDKVVDKLDLREETIDVPPQECFTKDEVKVTVDGVMYISVVEPVKAAYGITNYRFGAIQLAQTTTRSVIGKLDLDRTFEERDLISSQVVSVLEKAGEMWGVRVHRYEVSNITPPPTVKDSMEQQVTAERDRKAIVAKSEGDRQSRINRSEGMMMELINKSEGEMQRRINEAEGRAAEILAIAGATAESLEKLAAAISEPRGEAAVRLQLTEKLLDRLNVLADAQTHVLLPADLTQVDDLLRGLGLQTSSNRFNAPQ